MTVDAHNHIQANLEMLRTELERLFTLFEEGFDHQTMVYEHWNAKDILGHLTYWHESFARNISDLSQVIPLRNADTDLVPVLIADALLHL